MVSAIVGRLPDDLNGHTWQVVHPDPDLSRCLFGASEWCRDGLLRITEATGTDREEGPGAHGARRRRAWSEASGIRRDPRTEPATVGSGGRPVCHQESDERRT